MVIIKDQRKKVELLSSILFANIFSGKSHKDDYEGEANENWKPPTSLFVSPVLNEQSPIFLLQFANWFITKSFTNCIDL